MAFLVLLLVSLASLTRVETQVASNSQALSLARKNALLGLNIALGQLQKYTGPDRRITARAEILDADPLDRDGNGQPVIDTSALPHPYWTGVWDSSKWHPLTGVYDGLGVRGRQRPEAMVWLVSGNEAVGNTFKPTTALASAAVKQALFSGVTATGGVDTANPRVEAPLVDIKSSAVPGMLNEQIVGHYAYWIGDEGVKAKINSVAPVDVANASASGSSTGEEYYWKAMMPARAGAERMLTGASVDFPDFGQVFATDADGAASREQLRRVVSPEQLALLQAGSSATAVLPAAGLRRHAFDLTTVASGVLADTVRGGLRLDLTRYLETGNTDGAFTATQSIYSDAGLSGGRQPSYALLKSWYDIGRGLGTGFNVSSSLQSETVSGNTITGMGLYPVITRYHLAYSAMGDGVGQMAKVLIHPSVTLWNPHNVTLAAEDMVLELEEQLTIQMAVEARRDDGTAMTSPKRYLTNGGNLTRTDSLADNLGGGGAVRVRLEGVSLAPGEAVVYTLAGGSGGSPLVVAPAPAGSSDPDTFPLMIPYWTSQNFIAVPMPGLTLASTPALAVGEHLEYAMARTPIFSSSAPVENFRFKARLYRSANYPGPALQNLENPSTQADPFTLTSGDPLTPVSGAPPAYAFNATPSTTSGEYRFTSALMRLPASRGSAYISGTTAFQTAASFAQFNLRGAYGAMTTFENRRGSSEGDPFFFWSRGLSMPIVPVVPGSTKDLAFAGLHFEDKGQGNAAVMFDYPRTATADPSNGGYPAVVSLGEFQHVDLSSYAFQPSYVFGNSWPDPRLGRETVSGRWSGFSSATIEQTQFAGNDYLLRDASYLANHALWDRFFLSTIPQHSGGGSGAFDTSVTLANIRLRPVPGMVSGSPGFPAVSDVRSVTKAAGSLLLDGAFNVNSTSVAAWRAFLGGMSGVGVPDGGATPAGSTANPDSQGLKNNYSRFLLPQAHPFNSASSTFSAIQQTGAASPAAWSGHRYLTDTELDILARNLVEEVKLRGPFMSVADFVNRRLITAEADEATAVTTDINKHRRKVGALGAIQKAILNLTDLTSGLNAALNEPVMGSAAFTYGGKTAQVFGDTGGGWRQLSSTSTHPSQLELLNGGLVAQLAYGAPGYLTQADVLQKMGGLIAARSDTFVIRTYGDVRNPVTGSVEGRAWCEAIAQRLPAYVNATQPPEAGSSAAGSTPLDSINQAFGRRYVVISFRWLGPDDL